MDRNKSFTILSLLVLLLLLAAPARAASHNQDGDPISTTIKELYSSITNTGATIGDSFSSIFTCEPVQDVDFTWYPSYPYLYNYTVFTASATGTAPLSYAWDFGDGVTGTGEQHYHVFVSSGTFTVTLTVSNECSQMTVLHPVTAGGDPNLEISPTSLTQELTPDNTAVQQLTLCNTGDIPTDWEVFEYIGVLRPPPIIIPPTSTPPARANSPAALDTVQAESQDLGNDILIIEDTLPWSVDSTQAILTESWRDFDQIGSEDIPSVNLSHYRLVIIGSDQNDNFYNIFNANFAKFDAFVNNGGDLWFGTATSSPGITNPLLPGGVVLNDDIYSQYGDVAIDHPWVDHVPSHFEGFPASTGEFSNLYPGSIVVATSATTGNPTLVDYSYGYGRVLITSLTLEAGWHYNWSEGGILANSLDDLPSDDDAPWLDKAPITGTLAAGECTFIDVTFDSTALMPDSLQLPLIIISHYESTWDTIPVTLTVVAPDIDVSVPPLTAELCPESTTQFPATICNSGSTLLSWEFSESPVVDWLSESPDAGNLQPNECQEVELSVDSGSLMPANYATDLLITSNDPFEPQVTLPVSLTVFAPADIFSVDYTINNLDVSFDSAASGSLPLTYAWDFGDGGTSTLEDPTHSYSLGGSYPVLLDVSNICGVASWADEVTVCDPVQDVDFTWYPSYPYTNETIAFSGTITGGGVPFTFTWDWGDSTTGSGQYATHSYSRPGDYVVTLTVTNDCSTISVDAVLTVSYYYLYLPLIYLLGLAFNNIHD